MIGFKLNGHRKLATRPLTTSQQLSSQLKAEIARRKDAAARRKVGKAVGEFVPVGRFAAEGIEAPRSSPKPSVTKPKTNAAALRFLDLAEVEKLTNR